MSGTEYEKVDRRRSWRLLTGDVSRLTELPKESVALVCTDPPYNIGIGYYGQSKKLDRLPKEAYVRWVESWVAECHRLLEPDGSIWILINDEYVGYYQLALEKCGFHYRNLISWNESFGTQTQTKFARLKRSWWYYVKSPRNFVFNREAVLIPSARQTKYADRRAAKGGKVMGDVWDDIPRLCGTFKERIEGFDTQLPLKMLKRIISVCSNEGDTVLDCFSGSATCGKSALELGRSYVGVERNEWAAAMSAQRLMGKL